MEFDSAENLRGAGREEAVGADDLDLPHVERAEEMVAPLASRAEERGVHRRRESRDVRQHQGEGSAHPRVAAPGGRLFVQSSAERRRMADTGPSARYTCANIVQGDTFNPRNMTRNGLCRPSTSAD